MGRSARHGQGLFTHLVTPFTPSPGRISPAHRRSANDVFTSARSARQMTSVPSKWHAEPRVTGPQRPGRAFRSWQPLPAGSRLPSVPASGSQGAAAAAAVSKSLNQSAKNSKRSKSQAAQKSAPRGYPQVHTAWVQEQRSRTITRFIGNPNLNQIPHNFCIVSSRPTNQDSAPLLNRFGHDPWNLRPVALLPTHLYIVFCRSACI